MKNVYIETFSSLLCTSDCPVSEIKKELEERSGQKFRRINRYILLALAGAFRLSNAQNLSPSTSLYIGTKNGCITETVSMLSQIYRDSLLPMPFTFIGSSANMASYHIANSLAIEGGNYTLSHRYAPLEIALEMAYYDIANDKTASAIVGCVDEAALPLEPFKEVVEMSEVAEPLEGGVWLVLTTVSDNAVAEIMEAKRFKCYEEIVAYLPKEAFIIRDDSSTHANTYVGSNSAVQLIEALEKSDVHIALVTQIGKHQFSLIIIKNLREKDYNKNNKD